MINNASGSWKKSEPKRDNSCVTIVQSQVTCGSQGVKGPIHFLKSKTFCVGACSEWVLNHNWALIKKYKNNKQQKMTEKEIFHKK